MIWCWLTLTHQSGKFWVKQIGIITVIKYCLLLSVHPDDSKFRLILFLRLTDQNIISSHSHFKISRRLRNFFSRYVKKASQPGWMDKEQLIVTWMEVLLTLSIRINTAFCQSILIRIGVLWETMIYLWIQEFKTTWFWSAAASNTEKNLFQFLWWYDKLLRMYFWNPKYLSAPRGAMFVPKGPTA